MNRLTLLKDYRIVLGYRLAEFQKRKGDENKKMARFYQGDIDEVTKWIGELKSSNEIGSTALLDYLHGIWRFLQPETREDIAGRIIGKHGPFVKQEMIDRGMIKSND